jgi:hypothetical protein
MNQSQDQGGEDAPGLNPELRPGGGEGIPEVPGLSSAKMSRRVSLTNIVLALVLSISAGSLYLMRKEGKGAGITFQVSKIDYELGNATKTNPEHDRILAELAATGAGPRLLAEKRIQKNPFQLETHSPLPPPPDTDLERRRRAEQERLERERRQQEIRARLHALELNGVMGGSVPLARISGQTVRVGDVVADHFKVTAIHPEDRAVEVVVEGETYTLQMTETGPKRPMSPRR